MAQVLTEEPLAVGHGTDAELLRDAYDRHRGWIFDLCMGYLRSREDAEDAVHETFERVARHLHKLEGDVRPYLSSIARNVCCDEFRRRRRTVLVEAVEPAGKGLAAEDKVLDRAVLERLWHRLSSRERTLVEHTFAGLTQEEIAKRTGLSPNAVAVALLRARQRMRVFAEAVLAAAVGAATAKLWHSALAAGGLPQAGAAAAVHTPTSVIALLTAAHVAAAAHGVSVAPTFSAGPQPHEIASVAASLMSDAAPSSRAAGPLDVSAAFVTVWLR